MVGGGAAFLRGCARRPGLAPVAQGRDGADDAEKTDYGDYTQHEKRDHEIFPFAPPPGNSRYYLASRVPTGGGASPVVFSIT